MARALTLASRCPPRRSSFGTWSTDTVREARPKPPRRGSWPRLSCALCFGQTVVVTWRGALIDCMAFLRKARAMPSRHLWSRHQRTYQKRHGCRWPSNFSPAVPWCLPSQGCDSLAPPSKAMVYAARLFDHWPRLFVLHTVASSSQKLKSV